MVRPAVYNWWDETCRKKSCWRRRRQSPSCWRDDLFNCAIWDAV